MDTESKGHAGNGVLEGVAMLIRMTPGVVVEELEGEVLLCDTDRAVVHRVPTMDAPWVADLAAGATVEVGDGAIVDELVGAGLVEAADEPVGTDRRRIMTRAVGAAAVAGAASIALPSVAAAASDPPDNPS